MGVGEEERGEQGRQREEMEGMPSPPTQHVEASQKTSADTLPPRHPPALMVLKGN